MTPQESFTELTQKLSRFHWPLDCVDDSIHGVYHYKDCVIVSTFNWQSSPETFYKRVETTLLVIASHLLNG